VGHPDWDGAALPGAAASSCTATAVAAAALPWAAHGQAVAVVDERGRGGAPVSSSSSSMYVRLRSVAHLRARRERALLRHCVTSWALWTARRAATAAALDDTHDDRVVATEQGLQQRRRRRQIAGTIAERARRIKAEVVQESVGGELAVLGGWAARGAPHATDDASSWYRVPGLGGTSTSTSASASTSTSTTVAFAPPPPQLRDVQPQWQRHAPGGGGGGGGGGSRSSSPGQGAPQHPPALTRDTALTAQPPPPLPPPPAAAAAIAGANGATEVPATWPWQQQQQQQRWRQHQHHASSVVAATAVARCAVRCNSHQPGPLLRWRLHGCDRLHVYDKVGCVPARTAIHLGQWGSHRPSSPSLGQPAAAAAGGAGGAGAAAAPLGPSSWQHAPPALSAPAPTPSPRHQHRHRAADQHGHLAGLAACAAAEVEAEHAALLVRTTPLYGRYTAMCRPGARRFLAAALCTGIVRSGSGFVPPVASECPAELTVRAWLCRGVGCGLSNGGCGAAADR
jgi:hypothetical protein